MANCLNYKDNGGDRLVIGGTLKIESGATVSGLPASALPIATASAVGGVKIGDNIGVTSAGVISVSDAGASVKGVVKQGVAVADAVGEAPTKAEFDALLTSLRNAGVIASA